MQGLQVALGLDGEDFWVLAAGLGGGIGRQLTCGTVTGGVLAIGLAVARRERLGRDSAGVLWSHTLPKVSELTRRFEERFGALDCRTLTGVAADGWSPEGWKAFAESGAGDRACRPAVRFAMETVASLIRE